MGLGTPEIGCRNFQNFSGLGTGRRLPKFSKLRRPGHPKDGGRKEYGASILLAVRKKSSKLNTL